MQVVRTLRLGKRENCALGYRLQNRVRRLNAVFSMSTEDLPHYHTAIRKAQALQENLRRS